VAKAKKPIAPVEEAKPTKDVKPKKLTKAKEEAKPKYDPEFYEEDGWPKLPDFLNRKLLKEKNDQLVKKSTKQKGK
jgi:hypothetical protein